MFHPPPPAGTPVVAACPAGTSVISGGWAVLSYLDAPLVTQSFPTASNEWQVVVDEYYSIDGITVYAVCATIATTPP